MASTLSTNVTLSPDNEFCDFIEQCNYVGAYQVKVTSEIQEGSHAIFHIASSNDGQKKVKCAVGVAGNNGELLHILWPEDNHPVLTYINVEHAPQEKRHYNLKIT